MRFKKGDPVIWQDEHTVKIKGEDPNRQYHEWMSNVSFAQIDNLEITNIEFVSKL